MTVDALTPPDIATITGTGPYPIPHEYRDADDFLVEVVDGTEFIELDAADWSVAPQSGASGNLTLSGTAATTYLGKQLQITRATPTEQGWVGQNGAREKGLELQMDMIVMRLQELGLLSSTAFRLRSGTVIPLNADAGSRAGRVLSFSDDGAQLVVGPNKDEIGTAQEYAEQARDAAEDAQQTADDLAAKSALVTSTIIAAVDLTNPVTLGWAPASAAHVSVYIDGVKQHSDQYSVAGDQLTMTGGWPVGITSVEVLLRGFIVPDVANPVDLPQYATRAEAVALIAAGDTYLLSRPGFIAGGLQYDRLVGATYISDMPGFVPGGWAVLANHFGAAPGVAAAVNNTAFQAANDYCDAVGINTFAAWPGTYAIGAKITLTGGVRFNAGGSRGGGWGVLFECTGSFTSLFEIGNKFSGCSGFKAKANGACSVAVTFIAGLGGNGNLEVEDLWLEGFDYDIRNLGADFWHVRRVTAFNTQIANIQSDDCGLNSSIEGCFLYSWAADVVGIVLNKVTQQPEGLRILSNVVFAVGGRPFTINAGLELYLNDNIFDQCADGGIIDGTASPLSLIKINSWIGSNTGSGQTAGLKVMGTAIDLDISGSTISTKNAIGVWLANAGIQNFKMIGTRIKILTTTGNEVGFRSDGAVGTMGLGSTIECSAGKSVLETSTGTAIWCANRFTPAPAYADTGGNHALLMNFGFGTAPAAPALASMFLADGSGTDLSLAFMSDQDTGLRKTPDGWGGYVSGLKSIDVTDQGLMIPKDKGLTGTENVLADDGVMSFAPPFSNGVIGITVSGQAYCEFVYRVGAFPHCEIAISNPPANIFERTTGALTGTTGTDARLTVSTHTDGLIYVENRLGSPKSIITFFRGGQA